ncbi:MAG: hypothetical protein L0I24_00175 [Pseudonocardia sp.]|nr:hypothetical protein [Pseudonocardia sp.]
MADHTLRPTGRPEPVLVLDALKAVIALTVGFGWVYLDAVEVELILTGSGAILALVLTLLTRRQVTPVSDPVAVSGDLLLTPAEFMGERRDRPVPGHGWPFH